jgi:hypothetical protein
MVRRNPLAAMSGELERNFILRMNHDIAVVVERPREAAGGRQVVSLGLAAVAVALLILQHGFEFLRSFWGVFAGLDLLLAFGFAGLLFTRFWTSRNWHDAVHERRFELLLVGLCAALLVLTPALPDKLLADVFPGLPYRSAWIELSSCSCWETSAYSLRLSSEFSSRLCLWRAPLRL